jgi:hypothetical protein
MCTVAWAGHSRHIGQDRLKINNRFLKSCWLKTGWRWFHLRDHRVGCTCPRPESFSQPARRPSPGGGELSFKISRLRGGSKVGAFCAVKLVNS